MVNNFARHTGQRILVTNPGAEAAKNEIISSLKSSAAGKAVIRKFLLRVLPAAKGHIYAETKNGVNEPIGTVKLSNYLPQRNFLAHEKAFFSANCFFSKTITNISAQKPAAVDWHLFEKESPPIKHSPRLCQQKSLTSLSATFKFISITRDRVLAAITIGKREKNFGLINRITNGKCAFSKKLTRDVIINQ